VKISVRQVCVHDVGTESAQLDEHAGDHLRIDVSLEYQGGHIDTSVIECVDESSSASFGEHADPDLDSMPGESRKECEEMALAASDAVTS
jgi:hypothetical protein